MGEARETTLSNGHPLSEEVQAHIVRSSKLGGTRATRDWALYSFFRIQSKTEFESSHRRMAQAVKAFGTGEEQAAVAELLQAICPPANADTGETAPQDLRLLAARMWEQANQPAPANAFRNCLGVLIGKKPHFLPEKLKLEFQSGTAAARRAVATVTATFEAFIAARNSGQNLEDVLAAQTIPALTDGTAPVPPMPMQRVVYHLMWATYAALADRQSFDKLLDFFGATPEEAGQKALSGGLLTTYFYEFLRQLAPAHGRGAAVLHPESARHQASQAAWDSTPITCAFTFSGLNALKCHPTTLESFPEPFKDGMAARAERLGDTGPSAPEHWDGALGLKSVHGYFMGGHLRGDGRLREDLRAGLRNDVRAFNTGSGIGPILRTMIGALTLPLGFEVMHLELGEDPYDIEEKDGKTYSKPWPYRVEHFGFRDGISQPFIDMGLRDTLPGGGTPGRNRTWTPIAAGEIFLGDKDEDGNRHLLPLNKTLRTGSTFLVFRKLEQDVGLFRSFLAQQRPDSDTGRRKLAAQLVGRWPNGTSLVASPDAEIDLGDDHEGRLNDFLYAADDPRGLKCPLSAHVRRSNPRDIGGTDEVRRHRILRRGMAYGGALLPKDSLGDGNRRGLLFICANSRIDLQFEVIQADWLNGGELLGQAGLNRCPLTGANSGRVTDAFAEAGAAAPVTGLPRFVITRGGDYFFAPGLPALRDMASEQKAYFVPEMTPHLRASMGRSRTPALFTPERIKSLMPRLLFKDPAIRYQLKQPRPAAATEQTNSNDESKPETIVFLGRHADVKEVLGISETANGVRTSVSHYHDALVRLSRGEDMLVSTEPGPLTGAKRARMQALLERGWDLMGDTKQLYRRIQEQLHENLEKALRRCGPARRVDLVHDLAAVSTYSLIETVFGVPGPKWLTELAPALQFSSAHIGSLPPDWLQSLAGQGGEHPGLRTMQIWSILLFLDIVGNYEGRGDAAVLSEQAGSEFLAHLNRLLAEARERVERHKPERPSLLEAFVMLEKDMAPGYAGGKAEYYTDVRMLLLELAGATLANIPATFGAVMETVLKYNINLTDLVAFLESQPSGTPVASAGGMRPNAGLVRLVYEATRITSPMQLLMRGVKESHTLPSGVRLEEGEILAALIAVANFDRDAFPEPFSFSLHPYLDGPERKLENYLLFGAQMDDSGRDRSCWGKHFALFVVIECVKAAARLQGLRQVAGKAGEPARPLFILTGLPARFRSVLAGQTVAPAARQQDHDGGT
ncbi:MAG: hypothetical protein KIS73_22525 [Enhydrobacter sp.]|nr:hypothetical protein [Enhydrobacter sp.]